MPHLFLAATAPRNPAQISGCCWRVHPPIPLAHFRLVARPGTLRHKRSSGREEFEYRPVVSASLPVSGDPAGMGASESDHAQPSAFPSSPAPSSRARSAHARLRYARTAGNGSPVPPSPRPPAPDNRDETCAKPPDDEHRPEAAHDQGPYSGRSSAGTLDIPTAPEERSDVSGVVPGDRAEGPG
jgi:hypothetical protein